VVFSHHHPDHTVNAALFPNARIHDHWAVYQGDRWLDRDAHGAVLAPSVRSPRRPTACTRARTPGGPRQARRRIPWATTRRP
jgi:glyoxylase-like metal-dependent hydrolase (beta-lactamase superfamily II)